MGTVHDAFVAEAGQPSRGGRTITLRGCRAIVGRAGRHARVKRAFDVFAATMFLVALIPLFILIAVAIKVDSPGPVFFRVRRVGFGGAPLMMLKFRKMRHDASGIPLTGEQDPRLTRVGRYLTAARLDELPQFWDVLRGRMSIVGPRPEDPSFVSLHDQAYQRILRVRPGITGLSQLAFAEERAILNDDDPVNDYVARILPQKIGLDTLYADSHSILLDAAVLRWTIVATMFRKPVAVHRGTGRMTVRRRPASMAAVDVRSIREAQRPARPRARDRSGVVASADVSA